MFTNCYCGRYIERQTDTHCANTHAHAAHYQFVSSNDPAKAREEEEEEEEDEETEKEHRRAGEHHRILIDG